MKTISWRLIGTLVTASIVYLLTRKLSVSLGIGALDLFTKIILFYIHERVWNHLSVGKAVDLADEPIYSQSRNGAVLWLTGLSGSGKSTLADKLAAFLTSKQIANE